MAKAERQAAIKDIEKLRAGRRLVSLCNLDRNAVPANLGVATQFGEDVKEPLYRVLKETIKDGEHLDLFLYTRGGSTTAVWPIVNLLREFDPDFEVLVPYRAHSSGTLLALGATKITMSPFLGELSPIDPTTATQFNPRDPTTQGLLGIGVEDVTAYLEFWKSALGIDSRNRRLYSEERKSLEPYLARLSTEVHPVALGNVHRSYMQIRLVARMLLQIHYDQRDIAGIIDRLTEESYSHLHMINRIEAEQILGGDHVESSGNDLTAAMDALLRQYEGDFALRRPFFLERFMGNEQEKDARFIGGSIESSDWSYLFETKMKFRQYLNPPSGINIQAKVGQALPFVPGVPRKLEWQTSEQRWVRNVDPQGVTV